MSPAWSDNVELAQGDSPLRGKPGYEYELRNAAVNANANQMAQTQQQQQRVVPPDLEIAATDISGVMMTPLWIDGRLILARRITADGKRVRAGMPARLAGGEDGRCWRRSPTCCRGPIFCRRAGAAGDDESRMLASLPVRLVLGRSGDGGGLRRFADPAFPWRRLGRAWLLAAAAVAGLLWGVMRLGRRRAAFVSAVTHELRTPLTTFQMYAEMLAEGMVPDARAAAAAISARCAPRPTG